MHFLTVLLPFVISFHANASDVGWAARDLRDAIRIFEPLLDGIKTLTSKNPIGQKEKTDLDLALCLHVGSTLQHVRDVTYAGRGLLNKISSKVDRTTIDERTWNLAVTRGAMSKFCLYVDESSYRDFAYLQAQVKITEGILAELLAIASKYDDI